MFGVDDQEIETDAREDFRSDRVVEAEPGADHRLARLQLGFERLRAAQRANPSRRRSTAALRSQTRTSSSRSILAESSSILAPGAEGTAIEPSTGQSGFLRKCMWIAFHLTRYSW